VRWRVPGEVLPDLLHNTFETSMTLVSAFLSQNCELNTLDILIESIGIAPLVRKARVERCDERRRRCLCLSLGKQMHMIGPTRPTECNQCKLGAYSQFITFYVSANRPS